MTTVSLEEFARDPLGLIARVEAGELIQITRDDRPVVEARPMAPGERPLRPFGLARGEFIVPDDFDAPLPEEILRDFEDGPWEPK